MNCETCQNDKITYYRQQRRDGVWVVTARCANGHHPIKGKPFYPISQFDIEHLPILGTPKEEEQPPLFTEIRQDDLPSSLFEYVEQKRNWRFGK